MAYSDATRVDVATARMSDDASVQTDFRSAVKTFGDAVETVLDNYGLNDQDSQTFRDKLLDICRYMDACML